MHGVADAEPCHIMFFSPTTIHLKENEHKIGILVFEQIVFNGCNLARIDVNIDTASVTQFLFSL